VKPDVVRLLQLGDSALPIGRFVHSSGLEALLAHDPGLRGAQVAEVVQSHVIQGLARLDAVAVAEAHRRLSARDLEGLIELDRGVTARKITASARLGSRTCGRQLASLAPSLARDPTLGELCERVHLGQSDGNLAVVEGAVAAALSLPIDWAVLLMLQGSAASLLSAAVRLGRISATGAQLALRECEAAVIRSAQDALSSGWPVVFADAYELEIHAMRHELADSRLFMT
jgi:urease accessory protein